MAVTGLESRVSGDWFDIRERLHKSNELRRYLKPPNGLEGNYLVDTAHALTSAVESGTEEFKRTILRRLVNELEEAAFSSDIFHGIPRMVHQVESAIYVTAVQRGILSGEIRLVKDEDEEQGEPDSGKDAQIKSIIADVQEIVANDPSARMNSAIKNILMQLHKYRDEVENFRKLKEKTDPDRLEAITKNFQSSFSKIFTSIRKNYGQFQEEQRLAMRRERGDILARIDTTALQRHLIQEIEELSRIRSTLNFIHGENYHMREPLVALGKTLPAFDAVLAKERVLAEDAAGGEQAGAALLKMLAREIARIFSETGT